MEPSQGLLETTLYMLDAKQFIPEFKKHCIDSSILPLLTDNDLQVLGMEDEDLRNKFIRQCSNLPISSDVRLDLTVDEKYIVKIVDQVDNHLLLLNASMAYVMQCKNMSRSDIQLGNGTECLLACAESLQREISSFHRMLVPVVRKKTNKLKYIPLLLISFTASLYVLKKLIK